MKLKIKKLTSNAIVPKYARRGDAGMDLYAIEHRLIPVGQSRIINTAIAIELPEGYEAQIRSKSGLAAKHGIAVLNSPGTIDCGYRGEIKVILINHGSSPYQVVAGLKIAQLVIAKVENADIEVVEELSTSERGCGGLGSTGIQ